MPNYSSRDPTISLRIKEKNRLVNMDFYTQYHAKLTFSIKYKTSEDICLTEFSSKFILYFVVFINKLLRKMCTESDLVLRRRKYDFDFYKIYGLCQNIFQKSLSSFVSILKNCIL